MTGAGLTLPAQAATPSPLISNGTAWKDTSGNPIRAQGGNVLKVGSTYYWAGTDLTQNPKSVNLYSSADLTTWKFEGAILKQSDAAGDLHSGAWLGRPQLAYNSAKKKYVLVVEVNGAKGNNILFASSSTVAGTYTPVDNDPASDKYGTQVNGSTVGDHSVFVDGDKAYLVYVGDKTGEDPSAPSTIHRNRSLNIAPLNADWTGVAKDGSGNDEVTWSEVTPLTKNSDGTTNYNTVTGHEAPAMLKVGSTYYYFTSGMSGWNASKTTYRTSTDLKTWSGWKDVATTPSSGNSFGTQFEQIIPVTGSQGTSYLYNGDIYSQFYDAGTGGSTTVSGVGHNAWYPLTFNSGAPVLQGASDVHVDAAAGTLTANPVANGRFGQDIKSAPNWTLTGNASVQRPTSDATCASELTIANGTSAVNGAASQDITLAKGTYNLSFRYKSGGGLATATASIAGQSPTLSTSQGSWATATQSFTVSSDNTKVTFKAAGTGPKGAWLNVTDVAIWPAG